MSTACAVLKAFYWYNHIVQLNAYNHMEKSRSLWRPAKADTGVCGGRSRRTQGLKEACKGGLEDSELCVHFDELKQTDSPSQRDFE